MPFASGPLLRYVGLGRYETTGPTVYVGSHDVITIPGGFRTDLATVPRAFWALMPPTGSYEQSALVHDWHCERLAAGDCDVSSRDADGLFRRIAREGGAGFVLRWLMWCGVRWGALANPARRADWWKDAPAVLGITAVVLAATVTAVLAADHAAHSLAHLIR